MIRLVNLTAILLLAGTLGLPATAAAEGKTGIHGRDNRQSVESDRYPWRALGRVNRELGGFCSGVLVGPAHVLTAAHCLWNQRTGRWLQPTSVHFVSGYRRGAYLATSRGRRFEFPESAAARLSGRRGDDWAIVILQEEIGRKVGHLRVLDLNTGRLRDLQRQPLSFLQAGYSQDRAHILTRHDNCDIVTIAARDNLLMHHCDATNGDSGSPLMLRRGIDYFVIGIHTAVRQYQQQSVGVAVSAGAFLPTLNRLLNRP